MNINDLAGEIEKTLKDYNNKVFIQNQTALDETEKVLINNLKQNSPTDTGTFKKSWKSKGKKYKNKRYVGNTKTVGNGIPLSNILEYSPTKGKPFIKQTFEASIPAMANKYAETIKKGV